VRNRLVRQTPRIYGNLQKPRRDFSGFLKVFKRLLFLGLFSAAVWVTFFSSVFTVKQVEVQGSLLSSADEITKLAPYGRSLWRVDEVGLQQAILKSQPVVGVNVLKGIPNSLRIVVEERKPVILWQSAEGVSLVDAEGSVLFTYKLADFPSSENEPGTTLNQLPRVTDTKAVPVSDAASVASPQFVSFVTSLQEQMTNYLPELVLARLEVQDTTYDLQVVTQDGLRVQLNTLGDPAVQVRNLKRLLTQEKIPPTSQVDMRIDRWAYVRP
jgi:cell division septal protein FtsQ